MAIDIIPPRPADRDRRSLIVLGEAQQDVLAALGVERVHDYPGTLAEAGEAIKRHIEKKTGGGA